MAKKDKDKDKIKGFLKNKKYDDLKPNEKIKIKTNKIEDLSDDERMEIVELFRQGYSIPEIKKMWNREVDTGLTHDHDHPKGKFSAGDPIISKLSATQSQLKEIYADWQYALEALEE